MIPRLGASSMSFGASELKSARDAYNAKVDENLQMAQKQNDIAANSLNVSGSQISTQGQGQRLDVVA